MAKKKTEKTKAQKTKSRKSKKCSEDKETLARKEREQKIQEIKKRLLEERERLLKEAETALNSLPEEEVYADMGDQAQSDLDKNFLLRLKTREQKLLKKIELAIEKIDNGTYGICEVCGCEIGIKRLEARPVTTMCIDCKTEQEEEERLLES
ncbi:MAG: RNA polymerase-binding protein DksA [Nitrospirae bacterium]|nr:MAG: RNA polymerase-binding protein DksA [Nitrospirota bacterium]